MLNHEKMLVSKLFLFIDHTQINVATRPTWMLMFVGFIFSIILFNGMIWEKTVFTHDRLQFVLVILAYDFSYGMLFFSHVLDCSHCSKI